MGHSVVLTVNPNRPASFGRRVCMIVAGFLAALVAPGCEHKAKN